MPVARFQCIETHENFRQLALSETKTVLIGEFLKLGLLMQVSKEKEYHPSDGNECLGGDWTSDMDCHFADLLLNLVYDGNKTSLDLTHQAWNEMVALFNSKFGSQYTIDTLKNRYNFLRVQYNDLQVLLKQRDFSWDEKKEMGTAKDNIWNSYAKVTCNIRVLFCVKLFLLCCCNLYEKNAGEW